MVGASVCQAGDQGSKSGRAVFPVQPVVLAIARVFGEGIGILLVSSNRMG